MSWKLRVVALTLPLALAVVPATAQSEQRKPTAAPSATTKQVVSDKAQQSRRGPRFTPGATGLGDSYFPLDGNGGYDVKHYLLDISYSPGSDKLHGKATIRAVATQNLSAFNLELVGLTLRSIRVNGVPAGWSRSGGELRIKPKSGLPKGKAFTTVIRYDGFPKPLQDGPLGDSGFFPTDDGAIVAGQPHGAATWYPVNDHPLDKATYTFRVAAPKGLQVIANGKLKRHQTSGRYTTWVWEAKEPMASYLSTIAIGHFTTKSYTKNGIRFFDAIDSSLFDRTEPRTGSRYALSQASDASFKRLQRTIAVPAAGNKVSFWVKRDTEPGWDYMFVEAHAVGSDEWTTLPDLNGHTTRANAPACPSWLELHPFLDHYQSANEDDSCSSRGSTGTWHAASGSSKGYEHWAVDLSGYAGRQVEVSISYASDNSFQQTGLFVDDITVAKGPGSTSFEDDGDTFDGWTVPGAPTGSAANTNDWISGTAADAPPPIGET